MVVPGSLQVGGQRGVRFLGVGELIKDDHCRRIPHAGGHVLEERLPAAELRGLHADRLRVRPVPHGLGQALPGGGRGLSFGHPVQVGKSGLLGPLNQQGGLADPAPPIDGEQVPVFGVQVAVEFCNFSLPADETIHDAPRK